MEINVSVQYNEGLLPELYIHTCMAINVSAQIRFVGHTSLLYLYSPLSDPISIFFVYRDDVLCWLLSCPFSSVCFPCLSPNVFPV